MKFKKGDRVRVLVPQPFPDMLGQILEVEAVLETDEGYPPSIIPKWRYGRTNIGWAYGENDVELVNEQ